MFKYEIGEKEEEGIKKEGEMERKEKERGEMVKKRKRKGLALQFISTIKGLALQFI
jgi:hypothetical protein